MTGVGEAHLALVLLTTLVRVSHGARWQGGSPSSYSCCDIPAALCDRCHHPTIAEARATTGLPGEIHRREGSCSEACWHSSSMVFAAS